MIVRITSLLIILNTFCISLNTQVLPQQDLNVESVSTEQNNSIKIGVGSPFKPIANAGFRRDFGGIIVSKISYNRLFLKHFSVGPYFDYFSYDNTRSDSLRPSLKREIIKNDNYSMGLNLGYQKVVGKKSMINLISNFGYSWASFDRIDNITLLEVAAYNDKGANVGLEFHYHYFIEGMFSVGPFVGYQMTDVLYQPELLGFSPSSKGTNNQHLFWGFVMNFGF